MAFKERAYSCIKLLSLLYSSIFYYIIVKYRRNGGLNALKENPRCFPALAWIIKRFKELTPEDKMVSLVVLIGLFVLLFVYEPTPALAANTRLVQADLRRMGHSNIAELVTLEPTDHPRIYRASVTLQDSQGRIIQYWEITTRTMGVWPAHPVRRAALVFPPASLEPSPTSFWPIKNTALSAGPACHKM